MRSEAGLKISLFVLGLGLALSVEAATVRCRSGLFGQDSSQAFTRCGFVSSGSNRFLASSGLNLSSSSGRLRFDSRTGRFFRDSSVADRFNSAAFRRGVFEFFNDTTRLPGFSKILQRGNTIIGQGRAGNHVSLTIDRNGDLRDRFGRRVVDFDPDMVTELRRFYQDNKAAFVEAARNGNGQAIANLNRVNNFLARNGGIGDGRFTIDLAAFSLPPLDELKSPDDLLPGADRLDMALASLNYILNTVQTRCLISISKEQINRAAGTVDLDLNRFIDGNGNRCFNGEVFGFIERSDEQARCNGNKIRINNLIHGLSDPDAYYQMIGAKGLNRDEISARLGMPADQNETSHNQLLVGWDENGRKESGVAGHDQRVLKLQETQNLPGRACFRSLDFTDINAPGSSSKARSVIESGINVAQEAEEWLCLGANGFLMTFLFNGQGQLVNRAPAEIATGGVLSPAIQSVASCLDCHKDGFIGGGNRLKSTTPYTEQKYKIKVSGEPTIFRDQLTGQTLRHGDYYVTNNEYRSGEVEVGANQYRDTMGANQIVAKGQGRGADYFTKLFIAAQEAAKVRVAGKNGETIALVPEAIAARQRPVSSTVAARELGISVQRANELMNGAPMTRDQFDNSFCQLKVGEEGSTSQAQIRANLLGGSRQEELNLRLGGGASHLGTIPRRR